LKVAWLQLNPRKGGERCGHFVWDAKGLGLGLSWSKGRGEMGQGKKGKGSDLGNQRMARDGGGGEVKLCRTSKQIIHEGFQME